MVIKFIENLLSENWDETFENPVSCVVCSSKLLLLKKFYRLTPFIISNAGCQAVTNLASVHHAIKNYNLKLISIIDTNSSKIKELISSEYPAGEFEFKSIMKIYEENYEIIAPLYEDEKLLNSAFLELNIDFQIETIKKIPEFEKLISQGNLTVCGFIFDTEKAYGTSPSFYLINYNGITDPEEIKQIDSLKSLSENILNLKVKRIHIQV
ncbi:hypothetical protein [Desulfurobacterium atlanticum]|uniref:Carbonic anhydrase n=1 Tax=Desulfurobacterium atlanticum TaxID=240169 RepID=A0A238XMA5_9BACT|nr:hypothetical protein [Desulfurobacterium atlanticum]SNR59474.1 carbonic anhydrase [Desulfurobacterium atlanticum]